MPPGFAERLQIGARVAVDGVCLTERLGPLLPALKALLGERGVVRGDPSRPSKLDGP